MAVPASRCSNPGSRPAFTLVELLVVVGIIAVLVAILLPALARARAAALETACSSNLRQVAVSFRFYAGDHRDWLPYAGWDQAPTFSRTVSWDDLVARYLGIRLSEAQFFSGNFMLAAEAWPDRPVIMCPADAFSPGKRTYRMVTHFNTSTDGRVSRNPITGRLQGGIGTVLEGNRPASPNPPEQVRQSTLKRTSELILLTEHIETNPASDRGVGNWQGATVFAASTQMASGRTQALHRGRLNYAGVDSSVRTLRPVETVQAENRALLVFGSPSFGMWSIDPAD